MTDPMTERCECGTPAVRILGAIAYCAACADRVLDPIRARVFGAETFAGRAFPTGLLAPEYGPHAFHAICEQCGASWVALAAREACRWCLARGERVRAEQAALVLAAPDVEADDANYSNIVRGWAERLARAVKCGLVTEQQAFTAWHRKVGHRAHAA